MTTRKDIMQEIFFGPGPGEEDGTQVHRALAEDESLDLSVVLPFRNEAENLPELLDRLRVTLEQEQLRYELIFVDDGSGDGSVGYLEEQARSDPRIKVLVLSRNYGQHVAISAGVDAARGRMVSWMDTDLQERPEDLPRFIAKLREGFDIVYGSRHCRRQHWLRSWISGLAMRLLNRISGIQITPNQAAIRVFRATVAESLRRCPERQRYLGYLIPWYGFRSAELPIEIDPRRKGESNYSFFKLIRHFLTGLTSFSIAPLHLSAVFACLCIMGCFVGAGWVVYRYFAYGFVVTGWASLILVMLLLHSIQFGVLAILGEYMGLTYLESKQRPLYLCSRAINLEGADECDPQPGKKPQRVRSTVERPSLPRTNAVAQPTSSNRRNTYVESAAPPV